MVKIMSMRCAAATAVAVRVALSGVTAFVSAAAGALHVHCTPATGANHAPLCTGPLEKWSVFESPTRAPVRHHRSLRSHRRGCALRAERPDASDVSAALSTTDASVEVTDPAVGIQDPILPDRVFDVVADGGFRGNDTVFATSPGSVNFTIGENATDDGNDSVASTSELAGVLQRAGFAITAVSAMGAADCAYLTMVKLGQAKLACPIAAGACLKVLNSQWASVGPVPLAAIGCLAYLGVMGLSLTSDWPQRSLLWGLCLAMAVSSGGLMGLLIFVLETPCVFCAISAFASALLLALVETGRARSANGIPRREVLAISGLVTVSSLRAITLPAPPGEESFRELTELYKPDHPPVRTSSSRAEVALAKHLTAVGAACYTAWWCPHCQEQRENFGREAVELAPFIQCSESNRRMKAACRAKDIDGYPTWIIDGKKYGGLRDLSELAEMTGFTKYPASSFKRRTDEQTSYIWGEPNQQVNGS